MYIDGPVYADGIVKGKQTKFTGLNRGAGAGEGEICAMRNLTSDHYPLLATRERRRILTTLTKPNGLYAWEKLAWVDGTGFYYDGVLRGTVTDSRKHFAAINETILIFPDKKFYDTIEGEFGSLESEAVGLSVVFRDGTIYGEEAEANTIYCESVDWGDYFREGDAIEITGSSIEANNQTLIIREIDGHEMRFAENSFTNGSDEAGTISFKRSVPELDFAFENENRIWGGKGNVIYASKLGDPFNFEVYDGVDTDSFTVDTGSRGDFTGGCSYLGYPTFFKEDVLYKVYGSKPSNFEVISGARLGLAAGSGLSLAVANEVLLYLNRSGICMYSGGIPTPVSRAFGTTHYKNAVAGSDGVKYYVSMQDQDGGQHLFVYDMQRGLWHEEDETEVLAFAELEGVLYALERSGRILILRYGTECPESEEENAFTWCAEFADFTDDSPNKKGLTKMQIRLELEEGAKCTVYVQTDSSGEWIMPQGGEIEEQVKRSYTLAIIPVRADHYRIRLEGTGGCKVYSIARDTYAGSEYRSQPGRQ